MTYNILTPRKSLNKAFLKVKPNRSQIDSFKQQLSSLLEQIKEGESEEFHKNIIADFLKKTYYDPDYYINTKGRNDQVIHNGKNTKSSVGVIIEAKSPTNKTEMPLKDKINTKAMQELVLYFLRERITQSNTEVRHLVITNIHEWFVFDAHLFDTLFARDKKLVSKFKEFEAGTLSATNTEHFYKEIAKPAIEAVENDISFTYFNLDDYEKALKSSKEHDSKLIVLYKLLSPEHLLKLPFANDSNSLDKGFYNELLYIMGLEEFQEKGKKLIQRKPEKDRIYGTLLESVISKLESRGELHRLDNPQQYGKNTEERLFNVGLQLVITWLNRILFLKLLEAQLLDYNQGDKSFSFLNLKRIGNFNKLADLFFNVLAVPTDKRKPAFQEAFAKVPYLNSSLFEANELENRALHIDTLDASESIPVSKGTVLKDSKGKRLSGELPILEYLFSFLEAYDFSSEGSEEIQEENKKLINASVLGLIFEKINGYKDGSFFTPGFITMYMCRETIRRAVVEKFNTHYEWKCKDFSELKEDLHEEIKQGNLGRKAVRAQANQLINELKICDPAVGSGHFLVSALNELIAIKHELSILCDRNGEALSDYQISIENDELIITDLEDRLFTYQPTHDNSQRMQEALFHEKQDLIENCLFGVDINPNSVKICRLRLWIELLKSAYYKRADRLQNSSPVCDADYEIRELETLPNIDINIKTGNSLISRFGLDEDLSTALKKSKWNISTYRNAVDSYRNAISKDEKRDMERLINDIKSDFRTEINKNDPKIKRKAKLAGELYNLTMQQGLFEVSKTEQKKRKKQIAKLETDINKLETSIEEIKSNAIYENAFEWRFEFPEVLDDEGNFIGFDVVIGNPPYKMIQPNNTSTSELEIYKLQYPLSHFKLELFHLFFQKGSQILKLNSFLSYITPSSILNNVYADSLRDFLSKNHHIQTIAVTKKKIFEEADVHTGIFILKKIKLHENKMLVRLSTELENVINNQATYKIIEQQKLNTLSGGNWNLIVNQYNQSIFEKLALLPNLGNTFQINRGLITGDRDKYFSLEKESELHIPILTGSDILRYSYNKPKEYVLFERPKSSGGCWDKDVHLAPFKICIRQIGAEPTATLIEKEFAITGNIFSVTGENLDELRFILALINSKLIKYYWSIIFHDFKTTFPQVTIKSLSSIPLKFDNSKSNKDISKLASEILFLKSENAIADTTSLEQEIDQKVYELYGLTEEEIKIVEQTIK
jgi:adenine-specific DNA-methyltransferase